MRDTLPDRVRLGVFEVDLRAGELRGDDGSVLLLPDQPLQILRMLVEAKGEIVSRDEIQQKLWPNDTVVEFDHSINTAIKKLRRALGDTGDEPQYIGTIAKRGYRLLVPVERVGGSDDSSGSISTLSPKAGERMEHLSDQVEYSGLIGKKVSHYRVLSVIGGGGMGLVYEAEDLKLSRRVALKFLPEESASDPVALQRFEREAQTASSLNHPNICTIHEVEDYEGRSCIVMELLTGQTLRDWLAAANAEQKALPLKPVLDVAIQVADGLQAAHEKGIVHRDIKPANIFLTTSGQVKILDFGVAKLLEGGAEDEVAAQPETRSVAQPSASGASHLTRTGVAMGTAAYMSPEQVRGEKLDARTDLFSFGLVLYEMATGRRAFGGQTAPILHDAILKETPVPVHELNPTLPPELEQVINKSLEKDRDLRYQSAAEMRAGLQGLKRDSESGRRSAAGWDALRRMKAPTAQTKRLLRIVLPILLVATLIGGGLYYRSRQAKRLTEKDTVVLADFDNKTGDAVFDDALNTALRIQLEQTPFLNVLSDRKVAKTLQLMTRPADTRITPEVARELCLRAGSKAYIAGAIGSLGSEYVLGLKAVNCQSADLLAQEQVTAATKEKVLEVLGKAATRLRGELGESLPSVQKFDFPFEATTSSLEALKAYSMGIRALIKKGPTAGIPLLKRAIELDPKFPTAYDALAATYSNLAQPSLALEYATKAYGLRDRATEREKLMISSYYFDATGEIDKANHTDELWIANYPRDAAPHSNLSSNYSFIGQYEKSLAESRALLALAPAGVIGYENLGAGYLALNRLQEAKAIFDQALARKLDNGFLRQQMYYLAFLRDDTAQMEQQVAWGAGKPGEEDPLLSMQSDTEAYYGRLNKARDFSRRAVDSAVRADSKETAALWQANAALREAELGNTASAGKGVTAAFALSPGRDVKVLAALALARSGDALRAKALAVELAKNYPTNTLVKLYWLPTINAAIEISRGNSSQALVDLEAAAPYELGQPPPPQIGTLYPAYVRGQAYLLAHNATAATAEFQKLLDHSGVVANFVTGALAHLQIGRAYAMAGDTAKAKAAYQDFFTLWKDADPGIPIYKQAKVEYAKLR